jgi:hypothetical protein
MPQFAKAAGAKVIATTSSAEKAESLKKLGADHVLNYKEDKDWGKTARKLTPGEVGVDHIIEVGGEYTMAQSLNAVRFGGIISIIGFLGGAKPKDNILEALNRICTLRGIFVGSREQMEEMCAAIEANDIHPVVDKKVFPMAEVKQAYEYMVSANSLPKLYVSLLTVRLCSGRKSTLESCASASTKCLVLDVEYPKQNNKGEEMKWRKDKRKLTPPASVPKRQNVAYPSQMTEHERS